MNKLNPEYVITIHNSLQTLAAKTQHFRQSICKGELMNTQYLEYILEANRCASVNKAAKNCFISQSNLSNIIKNVEEEVGYPIFYRTPSGITPTPEGKAFMMHAEKIVAEQNNILRIPETFSAHNDLSILCARSAFVFQCFLDFKKEYPIQHSQDAFMEAGLRENLRGIVSQKCRLGILVMFESRIEKYAQMAEQYNLEFKTLKTGINMKVFMSKSHPLAQKEGLEMEDLAAHPFLADSHIDNEDTLDILKIRDLNNVLFYSDRGTIFDAVRKGGYLAVGINIAPGDAENMQCVCRTIHNSEKMAVCTLKLRSYPLNSRENDFIKYLQRRLNEYYGEA